MRLRGWAVRIAEHTVANPLIIILNAEGTQDLDPLGPLKFFFGPMDPAAANAQRMRGQHQVAHHQAAVIDMRGAAFLCQGHRKTGRRPFP